MKSYIGLCLFSFFFTKIVRGSVAGIVAGPQIEIREIRHFWWTVAWGSLGPIMGGLVALGGYC